MLPATDTAHPSKYSSNAGLNLAIQSIEADHRNRLLTTKGLIVKLAGAYAAAGKVLTIDDVSKFCEGRMSRSMFYRSIDFLSWKQLIVVKRTENGLEIHPIHCDRNGSVVPLRKEVEELTRPAAPTGPLNPEFDYQSYDWGQYAKPGDGGSEPAFYWALHGKVRELAEQLKASNDGKQIHDIHAYTLEMIRRQGGQRYKKYLQEQGRLPTEFDSSQAIYFSPADSGPWKEDLEAYLDDFGGNGKAVYDLPDEKYQAMRKTFDAHWKQLGLNWTDRRFVAWVDQAMEVAPFSYDSILSMPAWVFIKLAHDLEATCS